MTIRLLAVGDLHLGRRPGSLPEAIGNPAGTALDSAARPAAALERLVDMAIAERVHAVVFAGDVVEDEQDFFEAYGDLRQAVTRLTRHGVTTAAVAGNHDVQVLPALADELPDFRLLGRGGNWDVLRLQGSNGVELDLHGYSFPTRHVISSPLDGMQFDRSPGVPAIGVLHCDRDAPGSNYAPVGSRELQTAGLDAFLLGHIHKPDALSLEAPIGYLGSVTPLRNTETGARGPWLLEVDRSGLIAIDHWPLAALRWETLDVSLDGVDTVADGRSCLLQALNALAMSLPTTRFAAPVLGVKVRFTGRTDLRQTLAQALGNDLSTWLHLDRQVQAWIHAIRFDTRPVIDIARLAERRDPLGLLASRLLLVDSAQESPQRLALINAARDVLQHADNDTTWQALDRTPLSDEQVAAMLRDTLSTAIDTLLRQTVEEQA